MKPLTAIATAVLAVSLALGSALASQDDLGYQQFNSQQGMTASSNEQLEEVQEKLVVLGYDPGNLEGEMDDQTREAIRRFQESQGMASTGDLDSRTLQALGMSAEGESPETFYGVSPEFDEQQKGMESESERTPLDEDLSDKIKRESE